jgi:hypothetical protein
MKKLVTLAALLMSSGAAYAYDLTWEQCGALARKLAAMGYDNRVAFSALRYAGCVPGAGMIPPAYHSPRVSCALDREQQSATTINHLCLYICADDTTVTRAMPICEFSVWK